MARIAAAKPADYTAVTGPRLHNVFYPGEALTFTLATAGATGYEVRDHLGQVVTTGAVSGTILTLPSGLFSGRYGWWRLKLTGTDAGDGAYGTDKGTCSFCIFPTDSNYPTDPLRSANPTNTSAAQTDGILRGLIGAGSLRHSLNVADGIIRQGQTAYAAAATGATATLNTFTSGNTTSASMTYAVHVFIGSDLTGVGITSTGWTLLASQNVSGMAVRVYQKYGSQTPGSITVTSGAVSGQHSLVIEEVEWVLNEAPIIAPVIATGTGTTAPVTVDASSLATQENYILSAVARASGTGAMSHTGALSDYRNVSDESGNQLLLVTEDIFGTGSSHSETVSWTGSANWVSVYLVARTVDNYSTNLANAEHDLGVMSSWYHAYADGVRERPKIVAFGTGTLGFEGKCAQAVTDLAAAGHTGVYFEGRNEPNSSTFDTELQPFNTAVKAAGNSSKVVASGFVSLCSGSVQTSWLACLDAGMAGHCDVLAFHDYNMCNGDLRNGIRLYEDIAGYLAARGLSGKQMLMTEGAHDTTYGGFSGASAVFRAHSSGSAFMKHAILREVVLGVTPEKSNHYYDKRGGFDSVTTWQSSATGMYQGYAMLRFYTSMVRGKTLEQRLDFGDGNYYYLGGIWSAPSRTGTKVAAVIADDPGLDDPSFFISGNPSSVTVADCFGNTSTVSVSNGVFTLPASDTPQYVTIPAGSSIAARPFKWGGNVLTLQTMTRSNSADPGASGANLAKMTDGDLRSSYYYKSGDNTTTGSVYVDTTGTFPKTITLAQITGWMSVSRLMVETPVPWQDTQGILKDFDFQYQRQSDGVWVTAATLTHAATVTVKNYSYDDDTMYDIYTQPQTVWIVELGGEVKITGVRLVVRDASAGMWLDSTMQGSYALTKRTTIREVSTRNLPAAAVPAILA